MAEKKAEKDNKILPIILIVGALGVGGYFLWQYLKEGAEHPEKGFNITNYTIPKNAALGSEMTVTIIAQNNLDQEMDGFCRIIDSDTQGELFYEHVIAGTTDETKIKTFAFTTTMPNKEFKLRITTGDHSTQAVHSVLDWTINLAGVVMKITEHTVEVT